MKIEVLTYNSYNEFLDDLKPNKKLDLIKRNFIFRGQSGDWPLVPVALRKLKQQELLSITFKNCTEVFDNYEYELFQRVAEYNYLLNFYRIANTIGLKLPNTSFSSIDYSYPDSLDNFKKVVNVDWLPEGLNEIAALAQHYGLPTRLLDWTFDINVALYFASSNSVCDKLNNIKYPVKDDIVIWAIDYLNLERAHNNCPDMSPPIRFVISNYSNNPNLCAQKGILSYWEYKKLNDECNDYVCRKSLDELLQHFKCNYYFFDINPVMYKIILPSSENVTILNHISSMGYDASRIYPSYDGVKKKIEETIMLEKAKVFKSNTPYSPTELSDLELEYLKKFNRLHTVDKGRILDRMDAIFNNYSSNFKKIVSK